jgi:hypothetical protein
MACVEEHLSIACQALSSNPSTTKKKKGGVQKEVGHGSAGAKPCN